MKFIDVSGRKFYYKDVQPVNNEPLTTLLLIHGAGGSHKTWRYQIEGLSDQFRVIAVDLPGHGLSEKTDQTTIQDHATLIFQLMESLQLENVVLGGHSMGGAITLEVALKDPGRLRAMLLVGTGARLRVLPPIFSMIQQDFETAIQQMAGFMFGPGVSTDLLEEERNLMTVNSADVLLADFSTCDSFDVMDKTGSITVPTLILCGKQDNLTPPKYSEFLSKNINNSELCLIDNCGHMPMLEQVTEFNRCVSSFLARPE